jgi:hypothetical protein
MTRALVLFVLCCLTSLPAHAAQKASKAENSLTYDVYAGGLHALQARLNINQNSARYHVTLYAETYGLLKSLAPWHGVFLSKGWVEKNGTLNPEQHKSVANWRNEEEIKDYWYKRNGDFKSYKVLEAGLDTTPQPFDISLAHDTVDILTATLEEMHTLNKTGDCTGRYRVFDGDRNYEAVFRPAGKEDLKQTKYNIYAGPSILCTIEVIPGEGKWHKKPRGWTSIQEQGRQQGSLPTIWFAKLDPENPKAPFYPVKVRVKTDYGTLFMHVTSWKDDKGNIRLVQKPE